MFGLFAFKRSFGGEWIELSGNHERVRRAARYMLGRGLRRVSGLVGRLTQ
jgi:hypothetical protein